MTLYFLWANTAIPIYCGDALVSFSIFWYGNFSSNSGERLYYSFLAALDGNSLARREAQSQSPSRYQLQSLPRETLRVCLALEAAAGTKEAQTSREIQRCSGLEQKPTSRLNSLYKNTGSSATCTALKPMSSSANKCSSAGFMQAPSCPLQH